MRGLDMSTLMLPSAATMTTMTNTAPIPVTQKAESVKASMIVNNNNNNKQGREQQQQERKQLRGISVLRTISRYIIYTKTML